MMIANRLRGEIVAELDGKERRLCLTLGALAELEASYGAADLGALLRRFSGGRLSARDLMRIIAAGLRGGGTPATEEDVAQMTAPDGAVGLARIASDLLAATFGGTPAEEQPPNPRQPQPPAPDRPAFPGPA